MRKLVIQIPCFNEEETLGATLNALPKKLPSIDKIEVLVIDDGSTDKTVEIAHAHRVSHVISLPRNRGLAVAFSSGLEESLRVGADIIVNTDADNQYSADDIATLIEPVVAGKADMTVGARPIADIDHFSFTKKILQRFGSSVVRWASNTDVEDAPSGFRAISRRAAQQLHVFSDYTYTLETIIQAGQKGMTVRSVPIRTNGPTRPSRLIRSVGSYVRHSATTIVRIFITYRPFRFFSAVGLTTTFIGIVPGVRFVYFFVSGDGSGHVQSLILSSIFILLGFFILLTGVLADLIAVNRKLLEQVHYRIQQLEDRMAERLSTVPRAEGDGSHEQ